MFHKLGDSEDGLRNRDYNVLQHETRLRSKVFSLGQILNKPKEKEGKLGLVFPSIGDRVKFGRFGLESSRPIPCLRETYIKNLSTLVSLFLSLRESYTPNLSTLLGLETFKKVPGGGWVVVLESHFSVQLKPKPS